MRMFALFFLLLLGCSSNSESGPNHSALIQNELISPSVRARMDAIISVFENATPVLQYDFIENINDGRGYTAGRAGFTTANGDLLEVIQAYRLLSQGEKKSTHPILQYIPLLKKLEKEESGNTEGLEALPEAWKNASKDPDFRKAQDQIVECDYYKPAILLAQKNSIHTALGIFMVYDAFIQHGSGTTPDCVEAIFKNTAPFENEKQYLTSFLSSREQILLHPANLNTAEKWKSSTVRLEVMRKLLKEENFSLTGPIEFTLYEEDFKIP